MQLSRHLRKLSRRLHPQTDPQHSALCVRVVKTRLFSRVQVTILAFSYFLLSMGTTVHADEREKVTPSSTPNPQYTTVQLNTDLGNIWIQLDRHKAPITTANFLGYVDSGFYEGTIFHRVIAHFMAQGGGHNANFERKETRDPIINESTNALKNVRGSLAMARLSDPNSATSQFFINLKHNVHLDAVLEGQYPRLGYTVFGHVIKGMDVVEKIVAEPQGIYRLYPNAPNAPVRIHSAKRIKLPPNFIKENVNTPAKVKASPKTSDANSGAAD